MCITLFKQAQCPTCQAWHGPKEIKKTTICKEARAMNHELGACGYSGDMVQRVKVDCDTCVERKRAEEERRKMRNLGQ